LLPDFTGDDYSKLESAVLHLVPATTEEVQDVEQVIADTNANPEISKTVTRIASQIPNHPEIDKMATWAGFLAVATYMYEIAPDMDANRISMIAIIVAVWTVLVQRPNS
jgi:hypothetical protein